MSEPMRIEVEENVVYGTIVRVYDVDLADEFDDFLIETSSCNQTMSFSSDHVSFYFGRTEPIAKTLQRIDEFKLFLKTKNEHS